MDIYGSYNRLHNDIKTVDNRRQEWSHYLCCYNNYLHFHISNSKLYFHFNFNDLYHHLSLQQVSLPPEYVACCKVKFSVMSVCSLGVVPMRPRLGTPLPHGTPHFPTTGNFPSPRPVQTSSHAPPPSYWQVGSWPSTEWLLVDTCVFFQITRSQACIKQLHASGLERNCIETCPRTFFQF